MAEPAVGPAASGLAADLQSLFRTRRDVIVTAGSPAALMETAIRNGVEERVLAVIGGDEGTRFAEVAQACGREVVRAMVPPGRTLEPEHLAQFLDGPEVDAVALVHAETSTGALAPLEALARVVRARKNVLLLVDASATLGGSPVETDGWDLDFVFAAGEQSLGLPAGLGLAAASPRLLARAATLPARGTAFDLVQLSKNPLEDADRLPQVAPLRSRLAAIAAAGGIEARWKRHFEMLNQVEEWALLRPGGLLAPEGRRAWTVSCLRLPRGANSEAVVSAMADRGWALRPGPGAPGDSSVLLPHAAERNPDELREVLGDLGEVLSANC